MNIIVIIATVIFIGILVLFVFALVNDTIVNYPSQFYKDGSEDKCDQTQYDTCSFPYVSEEPEEEKTYMTNEEMIGILGELLDDTEHPDLPEYARKGIYDVYETLCAIENNW